jgi:glutamate racemase
MTSATFQSELYNSLLDRFAVGLQVEAEICPDFVRLVESGSVDDAEADADAAVARHIGPLLEAGADQIVLGCTHFPFLRDAIEGFVDGKAEVVDPAPAVARQTGRVMAEMSFDPDHSGVLTFTTSGDPNRFAGQIHKLLGPLQPGNRVQAVRWIDGQVEDL